MDQGGVPDEPAGATTARALGTGGKTTDVGIRGLLLAARRGEERRRHDAGRAARRGSLMRHILAAGAIVGLPGGVVEAAAPAVLIPPPGGAQRGPARALRAAGGAVAVTAVAMAAEEEDAPAVGPGADDEPKRVQTPPRSDGRAGHVRGDMRSRRRRVAPPSGDSARGPGVYETPGPHPLTRRRLASSTSAHATRQVGRFRFQRFPASIDTSNSLRRDLALDALDQALYDRPIAESPRLIQHSDRGGQYLSIRYAARLAAAGIEPSVGTTGASYDHRDAPACGRRSNRRPAHGHRGTTGVSRSGRAGRSRDGRSPG